MQQLAGVVPLVDGLAGVDALVALQPHELAARPAGQHLGHLGLADAGLALEQQRALQAQGEEDRGGQALVGEVVVLGERGADVVDGLHHRSAYREPVQHPGDRDRIARRPDERSWSMPLEPDAPPRVVVMGVTGAGKSTVGSRLAAALGVPFVDADDLHDQHSIDKMRAGIPLDDVDRAPWWQRINDTLRSHLDGVVVAASSLTPTARAAMTDGIGGVRFVLLQSDLATIAHRVDARADHFAGSALLPSQFALLDPPDDAIVLDAARPPDELVARAVTALRGAGGGPATG